MKLTGSAFAQHAIGLAGQISSALPLLLVTILISHQSDLEQAGHFAIFVGVSAVIYSVSLWGLRTRIVLDRFHRHSKISYITVRFILIVLSAILMWVFSDTSNMPLFLVVTILTYRSSDALIDTRMAIDQVELPNQIAILNYSKRHIIKLGLFMLVLITSFFLEVKYTYAIFAFTGTVIFAFHLWSMVSSHASTKNIFQHVCSKELIQILKDSSWFAFASVMCAITTNAPRTQMEWFFSGENLGVVGGTLSICTFFGMVFNMTWVRALPGLSLSRNIKADAKKFVLENAILSITLIILSLILLPQVTSYIFGFKNGEPIELSRQILVASVIFYCGQILSNLFKVTSAPWLEICSYLIGLTLAISLATTASNFFSYAQLICFAGMVMISFSLISFKILVKSNH